MTSRIDRRDFMKAGAAVLGAYKAHDIGASMMPPHMMLYGDELMKLLGPERATRESPLASAITAGLRTTLHCD